MQDPVERETVRHRFATRITVATRTNRDQRLNLCPQLVIDLKP
jgi:hypothetical protein